MKRWIASFGLLALLLPLAVSYGQTAPGTAPGRFSIGVSTAGRDGIPGNADDDPWCEPPNQAGCTIGVQLSYLTKQGQEVVAVPLIPKAQCTLDVGSTFYWTCVADDPGPQQGSERYDKQRWLARYVGFDSSGIPVTSDPFGPVEVPRKPRPPHSMAVS